MIRTTHTLKSILLMALIFVLVFPVAKPVQAAVTFTNRTTADGLGSNHVQRVFAAENLVYAATINGLSISVDGGTSFTNKTIANGLGSNNVISVFAIGSLVYAGTSGGLSISSDGGNSFTNKTTVNGLGHNQVNTVYMTGGVIYAATNNGLSFSTNGGSTFTNLTTTNGLGNNLVYSVYHVDGVTYAATLAGLSISTDDNTFVNRTTSDGLGGNTIYGVHVIGADIYVATNGGLSKSTDGGVSFTNSTGGGQFSWVNGVYATGNSVYGATLWNQGLAVSDDSGVTFKMYTTTDGLGSNSVYDVYAAKGIVYAATQNGLSFASLYASALVSGIGSQDGWILESSETSNQGGTLSSTTTTLRLGDNTAKKQYRSILSFATGAALPDNAVITKVTLRVRRQGVTGGGDPIATFQGFMVDIRKGTFGASTLEAADFQATANRAYGPFSPALASGWYSFNLTSAKAYVNKLATGNGLTQIRLRFKLGDNNNAVANTLSLFSGNAGAASRPQLIVEYYVP